MTPDELASLRIEAWKTTIQVQMHFNDIEMKIRSLAITVLTAVLTATAIAINNGTKLDVFGKAVPLGSALLAVGAITWGLFWFVDKIWYHRLLLGAVIHGKLLEDKLASYGDGFQLTKTIGDESPHQFKIARLKFGKPMHSSTKLTVFYGVVELVLVLAAILSAIGHLDQADSKKKSSTGAESVLIGTVTNRT